MEVIKKNLCDLKPYENNPRNNAGAVAVVANSIKEFGFKVPIVIGEDNVIVCGHTRFLAAKELGLESVPCIIADDLTPEQVKAFRLVDNKTAELSGWNFLLLDEELADICTINMEDFGFKEEIIDVDSIDISEFLKNDDGKKKPKRSQCPFCGEWIEL